MTPRLKAAIPKLASLDIERSVAFFERLGFTPKASYPDYGVIERNGVEIHFWLCADPRIPQETGCRVTVEGIQSLFETYLAEGVIHPSGHLSRTPWGVLEFSILDADGNLLTFEEAVS